MEVAEVDVYVVGVVVGVEAEDEAPVECGVLVVPTVGLMLLS